jgi:hypothetical protein
MIQTQKISSTTEKPKDVAGYTTINVLKWNNSKWKYLCPYYLKTDGREVNANPGNILFENFYQGSKVYNTLRPVEVYPSRFQQGDPNYLWWKYNATKQLTSVDDDGNGTFDKPAYLDWRTSLWNCTHPIRYPNGYENKHDVAFSLVIDAAGNETRLDYITARKLIYVAEYNRLIRRTSQYTTLLNMLRSGQNLLICEVDVPERPTQMTLPVLENLMNQRPSFGHGLCLAHALLTDLAHQPAQ